MTISPSPTSTSISAADFEILRQLEKKVLWLSSWMIHNANHLRDNRDGLKVGGHQASCASAATVMTALWFAILAARQGRCKTSRVSGISCNSVSLGSSIAGEHAEIPSIRRRIQAYPSRSKDQGFVDFSTGSVGLGVGTTLFASWL